MRDLRATTRAPGARLALVAVTAVLFGLMSMHGWGSHAGAHPVVVPLTGPSEMSAASHDQVRGHAPTTGVVTTDGSSEASGHPAGAPDDGDGGGLFGLCLAILTGLLLGVGLLLGRRGVRLARGALPSWSLPVFIGRDRDPPDLHRLCVIRC